MSSPSKYTEDLVYALFTGLDISKPANFIDQSSLSVVNNFIINRGELISRPELRPLVPPSPDGIFGGNIPTRALFSFINSANVICTVAIDSKNIYLYGSASSGSVTPQQWTLVSALGGTTIDIVTPYQIFINKLYFSMGDALYSFDGLSNTITSVCTLTGSSTQAGAFFIGELASHVIMLSTIELTGSGAEYFPQRVRWCASGLPTVWDPTVNTNAGFNDLLDVSDIITGFVALGQNGYIFRTNGITEMIPTGQGLNPFIFNHYWSAYYGIGNILGSSLASYGSTAAFVASNNIYLMSTGNLQGIGDKIMDQVFVDLNNAGNNAAASLNGQSYAQNFVIGSIVPQIGRGIGSAIYVLTIPQVNNNSIMYIYDLKSGSWTRHVLEGIIPTSRMNYVVTA